MSEFSSVSRNNHDLYSEAGLLQEAISDLQQNASDLKEKDFTTFEDAARACSALLSRWSDQYGHLIPLANKFTVNCRGEGVQIPNMTVEQIPDDDKHGFQVYVDAENIHRPLDIFESARGVLTSVIPDITQEDELYKAGVVLEFKEVGQPTEAKMDTNRFKVFSIGVERTFLAECSNMTEFTLPLYEQHEEYKESFAELAASGLARTRFIDELHRLTAMFHADDNQDYQSVKDVERVRWIARKCEKYALDETKAEALRRALVNAIGKNRYLYVKKDDTIPKDEGDEEIFGKIIDIIMQEDNDTATRTPVAVLENPQEQNDPEISFVPLKTMYSVRF